MPVNLLTEACICRVREAMSFPWKWRRDTAAIPTGACCSTQLLLWHRAAAGAWPKQRS
jgi:hypothetical protein